jgi:hypothetical protein
MGRTTVDIGTIRVPADDGTLAHALAALDRKLAAWAEAMRAAQQTVADAAKAGPPAGIDSSPHTATPDGSAIEASPGATDGQATVPTVTVGPTAEDTALGDRELSRLCAPEVVHGDSHAGSAHARRSRSDGRPVAAHGKVGAESDTNQAASSKKAPAVAPTTPESQWASPAVQSGPAPGVKTAGLPDASAAGQEHAGLTGSPEDEALLASLDSETASAVRVMRRLSPVRKSVRELLKEYEASRPTPPAAVQPKKKPWFSRGK